ncbi:hypothetical protein HAX54_013436 [Datura stramonium]|uniref:Anamorsin homolog n=1 Tax=Datura stramonium TaxID=4076 RepID=A0ABS8RYE0_DATST|nr:hypothetical protein [Datura stramonium]
MDGQVGDGSLLVLVEDVMYLEGLAVFALEHAYALKRSKDQVEHFVSVIGDGTSFIAANKDTCVLFALGLLFKKVAMKVSFEFPSDKLCVDISKVLKPGGTVLLSLISQSVLKASELSLRHKSDIFFTENLYGAELTSPSELQAIPTHEQITAKKPSWKVGASFSIKKVTKSLPKVQIDDDSGLSLMRIASH